MPTAVLMPALSPTMTDGNLAKWHVKEGDAVSSGDLLAEIETDKAIMEFEAVEDGIVGKLLVAEGDANIAVNQPIAIMLADGEDEGDLSIEADHGQGATSPPQPPRDDAAQASVEAAAHVPVKQPTSAAPTVPFISGERIFSSPLARRLARENNLTLADIKGSGPGGRIVKRDIERALQDPSARRTEPQPSPAAGEWRAVAEMFADRDFETLPLDGMRRTIAARLVEAKRTIPHFYLRRDILLDEVLQLRSQINDALEPRGLKVSINDFIIRASALALQRVPDANSVWAHDRIIRLKPSDVAVAVAIDGGLYTPVIRDAHEKSLTALSEEMKSLADKARSRRLETRGIHRWQLFDLESRHVRNRQL